MKSILFLLSLMITSCFSYGQSFSLLLQKIGSQDNTMKVKMLDEYFSSGVSVPVVEGKTNVYFLYKGEADSVSVAGDATAWSPGLSMKRIEGTEYWYMMTTYEPDARLEYKIVLNGKDWILDPLNPNVIQGGMGANSELLMPEYEQPLYTQERDAVPWGTYFDTAFQSKTFDERRQIRIYLPPDYEKNTERYPVAFFHDGFQFFDMTDVRDIMDNMIYEGKIRPFIAVFVEPVKRDDEYSGNRQAKFSRYMFDELIPFIDQGYRTLATPESRAQIGISNGGNIALWLVAINPKQNALVAAFSSNVQPSIYKTFGSIECTNQKIYLCLGKYDIPFLIPLVKNLQAVLDRKGCKYIFKEYPEGHNWKFWQKHMPEALEYLFPPNK